MSDIVVQHNSIDYQQLQSSSSMVNQGSNVFAQTRDPYLAKWNILFNKKVSEWISFKPQIGLYVYPCYACRDMFSSRNSFLDHVNRRGMLLKYKCSNCDESDSLTFYNPCSLLLHTRQHYTLLAGQINLDNLEVFVLPFGLAGFLPDPNVPLLYQVEDDSIGETMYINTRFYSPVCDSMGQSIVNLVSNELLFFYSPEPNAPTTSLVLKQISSNIPRCQFVILDSNRFVPIPNGVDITGKEVQNGDVQIKEEPEEFTNDTNSTTEGPIITRVETLAESENETQRDSVNTNAFFNRNIQNLPRCPECKETQSIPMGEHFLRTNNPFQDLLKCSICKYVAPTKCSLKAHIRIHNSRAPYVCPECGKDYNNWKSLHAHMEDVCFHLTKQVRVRCPGKKCGKIFAQINTFSAHFLLHIQSLASCVQCNVIFNSECEFVEHNQDNDFMHTSNPLYKCMACSDSEIIYTASTHQDHIYEHATDVKQCLYVYICKRCHSYFRSSHTYATHLLRCNKPSPQTTSLFPVRRDSGLTTNIRRKRKNGIIDVVGICISCKMQVKIQVPHYSKIPTNCSYCSYRLCYKNTKRKTENEMIFESDSDVILNFASDTGKCLLCKEKTTFGEIKEHLSQKCKYQNSVVIIDPNTTYGSSSNSSPKSDDSAKKKRKKKFRKSSMAANSETDMTVEPEEIIPFDGTYRCKLCHYTDKSREVFHRHIIIHRDVCTAYQCMECGECFVVKPSLIKHLSFFHQIIDIEAYFNDNSCFNKEAVKELEEVMHLVPGEAKDPIAENQCRVCLQQFNNSLELNKHFRIHGMAFLLENSK